MLAATDAAIATDHAPAPVAVMARRDALVRIVVTGRHRARFLHAMTTAEVQKLVPGDVAFALVATANGKHVGQLRLEVDADSISLVTDAGSLAPIVETLKKHKIADDVRFGEPVPDELTLALYAEPGHDAAALQELADQALAGRSDVRVTAWDAARSELGCATLHLRGARAAMAEVESALAARGVPSLDAAAWDARRIAAAWPTDAVDLGPDDLALFSERLLATVSWTKGCFLGQEVFVMARDRGEVPKRLRGIEVAPGESLGRGEKILSEDGKVVGSVGSSAGSLGLALVKRKHADGGSPLHLEDGRRATVVVLPRTVSGEA